MRRFRDNSWFDHAAPHRRAALRGWRKRHRGRRHRSNPVASITAAPVKAVTAAYSKDLLIRGLWVVGGNIATAAAADAVINRVTTLKDNKWLSAAAALGVAGVVGSLSVKFLGKDRGGNMLLGGMLVGLTRALNALAPNTFRLGADDLDGADDLEGLDDFVTPPQAMRPVGMNDYADPRQLMAPVGTAGLGDAATVPQARGAIQLDGMAELAVAEEIESQV